jgi:hypothetical protein
MSLLRSYREVRMSRASCSDHVHLLHYRTLIWGTAALLLRLFFYSTETGQRKISLISSSVFVVIRCYACHKILNLAVKGQEPQFSIREGHDRPATDVIPSLTGNIYRTYLRNFIPEFTE